MNMHEHRLNPHNSIRKENEYFIWRAEHGACGGCEAKDGKIFEYGIDEESPATPQLQMC
jgi:hypothetical protein